MKSNILSNNNSDLFGTLASTLCMLHCIATPFIFIAHTAHATCGSIGPWWWHAFDFVFLIIGFLAIRRTQLTSSVSRIPRAMFVCWAILAFLICNEKLFLLPLSGFLIYIPACGLVLLHLYNMKYCKCKNDDCVIHS